MSEQNQVMAEMPKYQCHKVVHALKIGALEINEDRTATLVPKEEGFAPFEVGAEWTEKFKGSDNDDLGYYVVYEDGYSSWSPTKAFEEGYSRI